MDEKDTALSVRVAPALNSTLPAVVFVREPVEISIVARVYNGVAEPTFFSVIPVRTPSCLYPSVFFMRNTTCERACFIVMFTLRFRMLALVSPCPYRWSVWVVMSTGRAEGVVSVASYG